MQINLQSNLQMNMQKFICYRDSPSFYMVSVPFNTLCLFVAEISTTNPVTELRFKECSPLDAQLKTEERAKQQQNQETDPLSGSSLVKQEKFTIVIKPETNANEGEEQMHGSTGLLGNAWGHEENTELMTKHVQNEDANIKIERSDRFSSGAGKKASSKCCMGCDRRIRQYSGQARSYPRKIGNALVDGYLKYLQAIGKPKTKNEVLDGYLCNACFHKYYKKYRIYYDIRLKKRTLSKALQNPAVCPVAWMDNNNSQHHIQGKVQVSRDVYDVLPIPAHSRNLLGTSRQDWNRICLNCDKRIRKTKGQARLYLRKIGKTLVDGYLRYLEALGKSKSKDDVLNGYLCSPCYLQYRKKYRPLYDREFGKRIHIRGLINTARHTEVRRYAKEEPTEDRTLQDEGLEIMQGQVSYAINRKSTSSNTNCISRGKEVARQYIVTCQAHPALLKWVQ